MALKTQEEAIRESMKAPKVIDTSVEIRIPRATAMFDPSKHKYKCSCCGKGFSGQQKSHFQKSNSPLFQSNGGYLPWCKDCTDAYYHGLVNLFSQNEEHAIEFFCQIADWAYEVNPLTCAREVSSDRSRIADYASKKNLNVGNRRTFVDSIKYQYEISPDMTLESKEELKTRETTVSASSMDRWGVGFSETDYKNLDEHYRMLKKNNPNIDDNQEIFIKTLSNLNMLAIRALRSGDSKEYTNLIEQYSKTFKQAGLKTVDEKDTSNDETFCMTLGFISEYTPEEFYKDKTLYADYDGIGKYMEKHITRPILNLVTGSETRDNEYFVPEVDEDEE